MTDILDTGDDNIDQTLESPDPALLDKTDNWLEKSCLSVSDNTGNMCCSRYVMCLVLAEWAPIFLLREK